MVNKMPDQPEERALLSRLAFSGEIVVVFLMVIILAMLFIPLPTFILDLFFSVNIALLLNLNVDDECPEDTGVLCFPTVLLMTTLFRLGA